jgi:diaminohydroxyphosphoribosylaminopyrimidine deaminase/5-amino-6-(5-phosphoribosylamino)uracil reductase
VTGILADEATKLNEKFICWHKRKRPFVHLKLAMSLDGRISLKKSVSTALSGESALKRVHELRHEHDAIVIGANTALVDNPNLTDRSGNHVGSLRGHSRQRRLAPTDHTLVMTARKHLL